MRFRDITHKLSLGACALLLAGLVTSCGASRKAAADGMAAGSQVTGVTRPPASSGAAGDVAQASFARLTAGYTAWTAIEVPFKLNIDSPSKLSASGRAYMTRGRDIYLSVRVLGLEVANMYVTADSVFASEKLNRRYLAEPLHALKGNIGVGVSDMQDMLMGRAFIPGHGTLGSANRGVVSLSSADGVMLVTPARQDRNYEMGYLIDMVKDALMMLVVEPANRQPIECRYAGQTNVAGIGTVCGEMSIKAEAGKMPVAASIDWKFGEARTSGVRSDRWKQPKGYTRVSAQQLIKMLKF